MPSPNDRSDDPDDAFAIAEAAQVAARETVPLDRARSDGDRPRPNGDRSRPDGDRPTGRVDVRPGAADEPTGAIPAAALLGDTTAGADGRPTVPVDNPALGNRETVKVPGQRRSPEQRRRAPLPLAAAFATIWAALLSYLPVAAVIGLARTIEGQGGLGGAAHAGLAGWLLGHGVPIGTSIGALGLAPLLLTTLIVWRLNRAGLHVTRAIGARHSGKIGDALLVGFAIGLFYSLLGSLAGLAVDGPHTEVSSGHAAINFFLLGAAGALFGALRGTDALSVLAQRAPQVLRHGVRTGMVAALLLLAAGAAVAGLSIAVGGGPAADMISAYRTGVAGQAGITLVSLAYGANGVVWSAAYLLGPGFALGTGSAVRLTEVTAGPLPTLPLLSGLPNGPMGAAGIALLAIPVVVGLAAGWLMILRSLSDRKDQPKPADLPWSLVLGGGLLAGPVAGVLLGLMCVFSSGSLGDGRMAMVGPDPWQVGLVATAVVAVSTTIGAAAGRIFFGPSPKN
ncbi:DUF6350 family protein [Actinoplanes sp. NPDC051411]|uniref:cell division protein PerM n=1 Tax=Actinoplanes sp. NPDC051411 TaxID=3155522 RepID=UPI003426BBD9